MIALVVGLVVGGCGIFNQTKPDIIDTDRCKDANGEILPGTVHNKTSEGQFWQLEIVCGPNPGQRYYVRWPSDAGNPEKGIGPPDWENTEVGDRYDPE